MSHFHLKSLGYLGYRIYISNLIGLEHVLQGSLHGIVGDLIGVEGALGETEVHVSHPEHVARKRREDIFEKSNKFLRKSSSSFPFHHIQQ